jgi:hypothetical protein
MTRKGLSEVAYRGRAVLQPDVEVPARPRYPGRARTLVSGRSMFHGDKGSPNTVFPSMLCLPGNGVVACDHNRAGADTVLEHKIRAARDTLDCHAAAEASEAPLPEAPVSMNSQAKGGIYARAGSPRHGQANQSRFGRRRRRGRVPSPSVESRSAYAARRCTED